MLSETTFLLALIDRVLLLYPFREGLQKLKRLGDIALGKYVKHSFRRYQ
jgi:hypothetical protein